MLSAVLFLKILCSKGVGDELYLLMTNKFLASSGKSELNRVFRPLVLLRLTGRSGGQPSKAEQKLLIFS